MKKIIALLLCLTMLFSFASCEKSDTTPNNDPQPVTITGPDFVYNDELKLSLTEEFKQVVCEGYAACYVSDKVTVYVIREDLTKLTDEQANMSTLEYAEAFRYQNSYSKPSAVSTSSRIISLTGTHTPDGKTDATHKSLYSMYKSSKAFWTIQFSCSVDDYSDLSRDFTKWAQSVSFIEPAKDFTADKVTITLNAAFKQVDSPDMENAIAQFQSEAFNVYVIKDTSTNSKNLGSYESMTDSRYNLNFNGVEKKPKNYQDALSTQMGLLSYKEGSDFYLVTMHDGKAKNTFYQVIISCANNMEKDYREQIIEFAKSVKIAE